jgi:hypothetical protein
VRLRVGGRRPFERRSLFRPEPPNPHASRHATYLFGIAGGFEVPGTVVPGIAGVLGDGGTVDGALGVAGGVVVEPGPVPCIQGGWITFAAAPFAAMVDDGDTGDVPGGCVEVVCDCGFTVLGAGAVLGTVEFTG